MFQFNVDLNTTPHIHTYLHATVTSKNAVLLTTDAFWSLVVCMSLA